MRIIFIVATFFLLFAASASSQQGNRRSTRLTTRHEHFYSLPRMLRRRRPSWDANVAYANTTVLERADPESTTGLAYRLAVDRRTPPQRAAQHAAEAELWAIVDGSGAVTTDGRIVEVVEDGQTVRRIEGGTVHRVSKGDFLVIPEGVPHQVTEFDPSLLIVTFEFPR